MDNPFANIDENDNRRRERENLIREIERDLYERFNPFVITVLTQLRDVAYQGCSVRDFPYNLSWTIWGDLPRVKVELVVEHDNPSRRTFSCWVIEYESEDGTNTASCELNQDALTRTLKYLHYHKR